MDARILRVVVASPGDVQPERDLLPRVIDELNQGIAEDHGFHLVLYRWETGAHPGFHPLGPQGLIDPLLRIEDSDLLIGIFWHRMGTPTHDALSGTAHEVQLAIDAWGRNGRPQIMLYFNEKRRTPKSDEERDQQTRLGEFRGHLPKEALAWPYNGKPDFERKVRNHLVNFIRSLPSPVPPPHVPRQIPPPAPDFVGRTDELADLQGGLGSAGITISGMLGMGGVGKTALALKLAELIKDGFPDGNIYLDLKGVSKQPLSPADAMAHVIHAWHPEAKVPDSGAEVRGLYRTVLDGKRVLLLMDNARDAAQVRDLVPPAGCVLLVTSRKRFVLPGLYAKDLDALPPADARELLLKIAGRIGDAADEVAKLCGFLPFALRAAGSAVAQRTEIAIEALVRRLRDKKQRLQLRDADTSVEATLGFSYELLPPNLQCLWRALAVFPGDFDVAGAAAVWGAEPDQAQDTLSEARDFSLLEWSEATGRYRLHDLARDFADERLPEPERAAAQRRHAAHYHRLLREVDDLYNRRGQAVLRALREFDLECANIKGGMAWALRHAGADSVAAELAVKNPSAGSSVLDLRLHPRQRIAWLEVAVAKAREWDWHQALASHLCSLGILHRHIGNPRRAIELHKESLDIATRLRKPRALALALGNLGTAYADLGGHGNFEMAIQYHTRNLQVVRKAGNRGAEAMVLGNLGIAYRRFNENQKALECDLAAIAIARDIHDLRAEGFALGHLGTDYRQLGDTPKAIQCHEENLRIVRDLRDQRAEGAALANLGIAYAALGETRKAIALGEQALAIAREIGDRRGEAQDLANLGIAYAALGENQRAIGVYEQALAIAREISDRRGEGQDLANLGIAYAALGETQRAIGVYEQALAIAREIGDRRGEGQDLANLGIAYVALGETQRAIGLYEQAVAIAREIGDRRGEGQDLANLGIAYVALGETQRAIGLYEQAVAIAREIGDRRGEGQDLANLGIAYWSLGETRKAIDCHEQCLTIAREMGDRMGAAVAAWNLGEAHEKLGDLERAVPLMQVCVDYERELGHPDAEKHAAEVESLRKRLGGGKRECNTSAE